ncbi:UNVERIFIED_CONTAM: hypothetical protein HDU68_010303 [Siphonaria sp. JEL0065]|nr:hypothetical protein HDU68_010303 [Siphonaria sp. JEL0065]
MLSSSESVSMTTSGAPQPSRRRLAPPRVRPNLYFEEGVGRKTGWRPPPNLPVDQFGFEDFDDYLKSDEEPEEEDLQIQHQKQQQQQYSEVVQDSRPVSPELNRSPAPRIKQQPLRQTPRQDNIPQPTSAKKPIHHQKQQIQQQLQQQQQYQPPRNYSASPAGPFEDPSDVFRKSTLVPRSPVSASQESPREQQEFEEEEEFQQQRPHANNRRHSEIPAVSKAYRQQQNQQQYQRRETVAPWIGYPEQRRYYDESTPLYRDDNQYYNNQRQNFGDEPMEFNDLDNPPLHHYQQQQRPQQERQVIVSNSFGSPNPQIVNQRHPQERVYRSTNPTSRVIAVLPPQPLIQNQPHYQQQRNQQPIYDEDEINYNYPDDFEDYNSRHASPIAKYAQPYARSMATTSSNLSANRQSMAPSSSTAPSTPAMNHNQPRQRTTDQTRGAMTEQPPRRYSQAPQMQLPQQSFSRTARKQKQQYVPPPQLSPPPHSHEYEEMNQNEGVEYDSAPFNEGKYGKEEEQARPPQPKLAISKKSAVVDESPKRIVKKPAPSKQATVTPLPLLPSAVVVVSSSRSKKPVVAKSLAATVMSPALVVGRHGRSKLSERVVTAVEEVSHNEDEGAVDDRQEKDEEEEMPEFLQQEEKYVQEQEEEEQQEEEEPASEPAYIAFAPSKDPKWAFPLLPGDPGYVAPVVSSPRPTTTSEASSKKTKKVSRLVDAAPLAADSSPAPQPCAKPDKKGKARVIHGLAGYNEGTDEPEALPVEEPEYRGSEKGDNEVGGGCSGDDGGYAGDFDCSMAVDGDEVEYEHHEEQEEDDDQEQQEQRESEMGESAPDPVTEVKQPRGRPTAKKRAQLEKNGGGSSLSAPKRKRKEWGAMVPADSEAPRGKRTRLAPVDYWRGEKIVYEMNRESMGAETLVPVATKILRAAPEEDHALSKHRKKSASKSSVPVVKKEKVAPLETPEFPVLNFQTGEVETQRLVYTEDMYNPQVVGQGSSFMFQRTFSVGTFCGSGMMVLPKGSEKPNKSSGPTVLIVYVLSGKLKVTIHKSSFEVGEGSQFMIPRGNQYSMKNTGSTEVRLFFLQGKETEVPVPVVPSAPPVAAAAKEPVQVAEEVAKPRARMSTAKKDQEAALGKTKKGNGGSSKADATASKGKKSAKESAKDSSDDSSKKGKLPKK